MIPTIYSIDRRLGSINLLCVPLGCFMSGMLSEATGKRRAMQVNCIMQNILSRIELHSRMFLSQNVLSRLIDCESANVSVVDAFLLFVQFVSSVCRSFLVRTQWRPDGSTG